MDHVSFSSADGILGRSEMCTGYVTQRLLILDEEHLFKNQSRLVDRDGSCGAAQPIGSAFQIACVGLEWIENGVLAQQHVTTVPQRQESTSCGSVQSLQISNSNPRYYKQLKA